MMADGDAQIIERLPAGVFDPHVLSSRGVVSEVPLRLEVPVLEHSAGKVQPGAAELGAIAHIGLVLVKPGGIGHDAAANQGLEVAVSGFDLDAALGGDFEIFLGLGFGLGRGADLGAVGLLFLDRSEFVHEPVEILLHLLYLLFKGLRVSGQNPVGAGNDTENGNGRRRGEYNKEEYLSNNGGHHMPVV